jgi:hypothetical protein
MLGYSGRRQGDAAVGHPSSTGGTLPRAIRAGFKYSEVGDSHFSGLRL